MDPFLALLLALAATTAADADNSWWGDDQLDQLRRKLGLWPIHNIGPGGVSRRLQWIESQFGVQAAVWAMRAAQLMTAPYPNYRFYDEVSPFLPWLAWRLSKGDAPDLTRVLEAPNFWVSEPVEPAGHKEVAYGKDQAWSDLHRLFTWFQRAQPDLFKLTWEQAQEAERRWYEKSQVYPKSWDLKEQPEVVWRDDIREDEDGDWIAIRIEDNYSDKMTFLRMFHADQRAGVYGRSLYVLLDPDREPHAAVLERNGRPQQILCEALQDWDVDPSDDTISRLYAFMIKEWPYVGNWPPPEGPLMAFAMIGSDDNKVIKLLEECPEILGDGEYGIGSYLSDRAGEWFSYNVVDHWARLANAEPDHFDDLYAEIAASQTPSIALIKWMHTGEWDHDLTRKELKDYEEKLPEVLHQYTVSYNQGDDADLTETHQGEYDRVLPWELKVWDIYRHPKGPELEVKFQGFVIYSPEDLAWDVSVQYAVCFKPDPKDSSTWAKTENFDNFKFIEIVDRNNAWGSESRTINEQAIGETRLYRGPFKNLTTTHSLDHALRDLWETFSEVLEDVYLENEDDEEDTTAEEAMERYFPSKEFLEPSEDIEIQDVFESLELLH